MVITPRPNPERLALAFRRLLPDVHPLRVMLSTWTGPLLASRPGLGWAALAFAFLAAVLWHLGRSWRALLFLVGSLTGLWSLFAGLYPGGRRHWGFPFLRDPLIVLAERVDHPAPRLVHEEADPHTMVPDERYYLYRLRRDPPQSR